MIINPNLLKKLIDKVLGTEQWLNWEPETLQAELNRSDIAALAFYKKDDLFTNIIDATRAVLSKHSMALMDWHLFENVATTFSGNVPDFYETTPPNPAELYLAIGMLKELVGDLLSELSEEVLTYIGSLCITEGIVYHIDPVINKAIDFTIKLNKLDLATDIAEQKKVFTTLANNVKLKKALITKMLETEQLVIEKVEDVMAQRAVNMLATFIYLDYCKENKAEILQQFLKRLTNDNVKVHIDLSPGPDNEHIAILGEDSMDVAIEVAANTITASIGEGIDVKDNTEIEDEQTTMDGIIEALMDTKEAAEASGDVYGIGHQGRLYQVTNEIGRDDVPKSKIKGTNTKGDVLYSGHSASGFTSGGNTLNKVNKEKTEAKGISSPSDSSLELAEI